MLQGWPKGEKETSWCQSGAEQEGRCEPLPCRKGMRRNLGKGVEQEGNFSPGTRPEKYGGRDTIRAVTLLVGIFHNIKLFGKKKCTVIWLQSLRCYCWAPRPSISLQSVLGQLPCSILVACLPQMGFKSLLWTWILKSVSLAQRRPS